MGKGERSGRNVKVFGNPADIGLYRSNFGMMKICLDKFMMTDMRGSELSGSFLVSSTQHGLILSPLAVCR